jgi:hypothetical protein
MSHHQNGVQNHNTKIANRPFKNVIKLEHLALTGTNQNLMQEKLRAD